MNVEISKVTTKTRVKGYIIHELNGKNGGGREEGRE